MIHVEDMMNSGRRWFDGLGPRADETLSTRVRLARNLAGYRFVGSAKEEELHGVFERVGSALAEAPAMKQGEVAAIDELGVLDRQFLLERHLLTHDLAAEAKHRGIGIGPGEALSVMINEEDHLRLQCLKSGMQLYEAWEEANRLDDQLSEELPFAFSEEFGYLTSCPTNVGTGLRASLLVHLPSLVLTQRIKKVLAGVTQVGLSVRGFQGEGSDVIGNFFQISNQVTLGMSEPATLEKLQGVVLQILDMEGKAREALLRDARTQIEDKVGRAYGTLLHARILSSQETMGLLSALRFGKTIGLPGLPEIETINDMLICSQPAHLQKIAGRTMDSTERNHYRPLWIQERLKTQASRKPGKPDQRGKPNDA
ncbi:MAG: protein arginine kinase [Candidatus Eisenbacteria bacterium]|nr:protein arginine kinase [Candidatus Eisenbacteria bacterium]